MPDGVFFVEVLTVFRADEIGAFMTEDLEGDLLFAVFDGEEFDLRLLTV